MISLPGRTGVKKLMFLLTAGFLLTLSFVAHGGDYTYITNNNTITITDYTGPGGDITIPDMLDGLPVTTIDPFAFNWNWDITGLTLGSNITAIGLSAFDSCYELTYVKLGNGLTKIEKNAFYGCYSLTNITIPASCTNLGEGVFWLCSGLESIDVNTANPVYSSLNGLLVDTLQSRLIQCPGGKAGIVTIPDGVTSIGTVSFANCSAMESVNVPVTVVDIEDDAFSGCTGLTALNFDGPPPVLGLGVFDGVSATVYYKTGTWGTTFGGLPTELLSPPVISIEQFEIAESGDFIFSLSGTSGTVFTVETTTNLVHGNWLPIQTNTLSGNSFQISDPQDSSCRFYRFITD